MKIVQINAVCGRGSTGKICISISEILNEMKIENYILYSSGKSDYPNAISCSSKFYTRFQAMKSHLLGNYGFNSVRETKRMIEQLNKINPDIVHLHNIHGHDCHLRLLFNYFKEKQVKLFWTFHDCWAFTGYCPHFDMIGCNKWQNVCKNCPQRENYSVLLDRSTELFRNKKRLFSDLDLTIITPSQWLADQVKKSFLHQYPIKVIPNGIDLNIFSPASTTWGRAQELANKKVVLGVAFDWGERKGLDVFIKLASDLDSSYQIVLVGTNTKVDAVLPPNILSVHRTADQSELAMIYSLADVFVNPTKEEVLGLVNIESLACGTPVVTFNTGGSGEMLTKDTGIVIKKNDYVALKAAIQYVCEKKPFCEVDCRRQAEKYRDRDRFRDYVDMYLKRGKK